MRLRAEQREFAGFLSLCNPLSMVSMFSDLYVLKILNKCLRRICAFENGNPFVRNTREIQWLSKLLTVKLLQLKIVVIV